MAFLCHRRMNGVCTCVCCLCVCMQLRVIYFYLSIVFRNSQQLFAHGAHIQDEAHTIFRFSARMSIGHAGFYWMALIWAFDMNCADDKWVAPCRGLNHFTSANNWSNWSRVCTGARALSLFFDIFGFHFIFIVWKVRPQLGNPLSARGSLSLSPSLFISLYSTTMGYILCTNGGHNCTRAFWQSFACCCRWRLLSEENHGAWSSSSRVVGDARTIEMRWCVRHTIQNCMIIHLIKTRCMENGVSETNKVIHKMRIKGPNCIGSCRCWLSICLGSSCDGIFTAEDPSAAHCSMGQHVPRISSSYIAHIVHMMFIYLIVCFANDGEVSGDRGGGGKCQPKICSNQTKAKTKYIHIETDGGVQYVVKREDDGFCCCCCCLFCFRMAKENSDTCLGRGSRGLCGFSVFAWKLFIIHVRRWGR